MTLKGKPVRRPHNVSGHRRKTQSYVATTNKYGEGHSTKIGRVKRGARTGERR